MSENALKQLIRPPAHSEMPALMKKFADKIPSIRKKYHPVEFSARLLMNLALLQTGYVVTIIPPILKNAGTSLWKKDEVGLGQIVFAFACFALYSKEGVQGKNNLLTEELYLNP